MIRRLLLWLLPLRFEHTFKDGDHTITEYKQLGKWRETIRQYQGPPEHWNCRCYVDIGGNVEKEHQEGDVRVFDKIKIDEVSLMGPSPIDNPEVLRIIKIDQLLYKLWTEWGKPSAFPEIKHDRR